MLNADLTNAGRQSVAGGKLLRLIVQTAFPSINLATRVTQLSRTWRWLVH